MRPFQMSWLFIREPLSMSPGDISRHVSSLIATVRKQNVNFSARLLVAFQLPRWCVRLHFKIGFLTCFEMLIYSHARFQTYYFWYFITPLLVQCRRKKDTCSTLYNSDLFKNWAIFSCNFSNFFCTLTNCTTHNVCCHVVLAVCLVAQQQLIVCIKFMAK